MTDETWTTKRILEWIEGYLAQHGDEAPRHSAQWLVSEALGISRMQLFLDMERPLSEDERAILRDYTRRRGAGEPLQYITGEAPFRYLTLKVARGVLIPRPETEVLVSCALELLPAPPKPQDAFDTALVEAYADLSDDVELREALPSSEADELLVADLCTGSGCIACALASEHAGVRVFATDAAPEAVALARENVQNLGLNERIDVIECDLGHGIASDLLGTFDLVVSNPPYVPTAVLNDIPREVANFEPALALDGGADGLDIFRRLLEFCKEALKSDGAFAFELHETTLNAAKALAESAGFTDCRITNDLAGKPRILTGKLA